MTTGEGKLSSRQFAAVVADFLAGAFDSLQIIANFLTVSPDFFFAGAVANIAAQFGSVFFKLCSILAQLVTALLYFPTGVVDGVASVSRCRSVVSAAIIMGDIFSDIDHLGPAVIAVPGVAVIRIAAVMRLSMAVISMARLGSWTMGVRAPAAMLVVAEVMFAFTVAVAMSLGRRN